MHPRWASVVVSMLVGCAKEAPAPREAPPPVRVADAPAIDAALPDAPEADAGKRMTGDLAEVPLADLLQLLHTSKKDGALHVRGRISGTLFLRGGSVYHAALDGAAAKTPRDAAVQLLRLKAGTFELEPEGRAPAGTPELGVDTPTLLMEAQAE